MRTRTKSQRPSKGVLGRLVLALVKGTGTRLSAKDVQVLQPMINEAVRRTRQEGREGKPLRPGKGRHTVH